MGCLTKTNKVSYKILPNQQKKNLVYSHPVNFRPINSQLKFNPQFLPKTHKNKLLILQSNLLPKILVPFMFKPNQQAYFTTKNRRNSKEIKKNHLPRMEARTEHQTTKRFNALFYATTALGVTIFVLMLFWVLAVRGGLSGRSNPDLEFNWHPLLMFLGMILLYSQAILLYRSRRYDSKKKLKLAHAGIHFIIIFVTIFGLITVFDSHNLAVDKPNLYTMHSWLGLTTVIAFCLQYVIGFASFLFPGFSKTLRETLLPAHINIGTAIFILASFSALMGFCEKAIFALGDQYKRFIPEAYLINTLAMLTALFSVLTLYLVNEREYKRENIPEDEIALTRNE